MSEPDLVDLLSGEHTLEMPFRTLMVDHEIEAFPAPYQAALTHLATLSEDLVDAIFEQHNPEYEDEDPYVLVGKLDDHEVRISVDDDGETMNVEACVEVLNQLLEEVHSELRYAVLPDESMDDTQTVVSVEPAV